jgi:hypothetical protein
MNSLISKSFSESFFFMAQAKFAGLGFIRRRRVTPPEHI